MKERRHHNNKGLRQIKRGKTRTQVAKIAKRLKIPLATQQCECLDCELERTAGTYDPIVGHRW